ncbi:MAG: phosphoribosylanthranilate isomerase [Candidatus Aureabacteria bacterium]|nr:phosphoribosylanthranilate isomerase [Candidatus Auribacterota bacterium]
MVRIKICGITTKDDALAAVEAGADALGFVFAESPRRVSMEQARDIAAALSPFICTVGVFVNESLARVRKIAGGAHLSCVQLHGDESPAYCERLGGRIIKAIRVRDERSVSGLEGYRVSAFLLDSYMPDQPGGTGRGFPWEIAAAMGRIPIPLILAGGLTPETVANAIRKAHPWGVDVSSGVESSPGKKDPARMRAFVSAVRLPCAEQQV